MKKTSLIACLVVGGLWAAACGDDDGNSTPAVEDAGTEDTDDATEATEETEETEAETEATTEADTEATEEAEETEAETEETEAETEEETDDATDVETDDATDVDEPDSGVGGDDGLIGEAGGTVSNEDGVSLEIPADSIDPPSVVTLEEVEAEDDERLVSLAYDFQPDGVTFDPPAMLTMPFNADAVGDAEVAIAWWDDTMWMPLTDCVVDGAMVSCPVSHFTTFGVIVLEDETMPDGGAGTPDASMEPEPEPEPEPDAGTEETDTDGTDTEMTDETDTGTDTGGDCPLPPCVLDIDFQDCVPANREICEVSTTSLKICYDNGVKTQIEPLTSEPLVQTWKKANGDVCYSLEVTGLQAATHEYAWKNPSGTVVMTATAPAQTDDTPPVVTYMCDGSQYVVDFGTEECMGDDSQPADADVAGCPMGTCDF